MYRFTPALQKTIIGFLLCTLVSISLIPTFATAQGVETGRGVGTVNDGTGSQSVTNSYYNETGRGVGTVNDGSGSSYTTSSYASTASDATSETVTSTPDPVTVDPYEFGDSLLYRLTVSIGGWVAWFGGITLNFAVEHLVIRMGELLTQSMGVAVDQLWEVVRDMFNILFIFMLIWIGLRTILNSDDSGVRKTLGLLIAAALLINFSLFITKSIVDFSNIAALQIYNMITLADSSTTAANTVLPGVGSLEGASVRVPISDIFMSQMNLSSYAEKGYFSSIHGESAEPNTWQIVVLGLTMMVLMILAGFVFFAGAVLLIYRFVTLVVLMIFSPAMFLGWIYPGFQSYASKWWNMFISNAFVAPAYLFMLYATAILFQNIRPSGTFAEAMAGDSAVNGTAALFLYFFLICGFLLASTRVATYMGATGAKTVASIGNYGLGVIKGENFGPVRFARRSGENLAGLAYRNTPVLGSKSYTKSIDNLDSTRAKRARGESLSIGEKAALGWHGVRGAGSLEDRRQTLEAGANYAPFKTRTPAQLKQMESDILNRDAKLKRDAEQVEYVDKMHEFIENNKDTAPKIIEQEVVKDLVQKLDDLNKDNIGNLKVSVLSDEKVAVHLTEKHMQKLKDSGRFSDANLKTIKDARKKAIEDVVTDNPNWEGAVDGKGRSMPVSIISRSKEDIEKLPDEVFTSPHMAQHLTPSFVKTKLEAGMSNENAGKMAKIIKYHMLDEKSGPYRKMWKKWINGNDITGVNFGSTFDLSSSIKTGDEGIRDWGDPEI